MELPFQIVYSFRFERHLKQLSPQIARLDDFLRGVEWELARSPKKAGVEIGSGVYYMKGLTRLLGRRIMVFYSIEGEQVHLLALRDMTDTSE